MSHGPSITDDMITSFEFWGKAMKFAVDPEGKDYIDDVIARSKKWKHMAAIMLYADAIKMLNLYEISAMRRDDVMAGLELLVKQTGESIGK